MTADEFAALEQARALLLRPSQAAALRARPFPSGMRTLLRVAAGDEAALELATHRTGDSAATLREASVFFVQQVMLHDSSDSYRILGVEPEAPVAEIKAHYGLLMRWMHPDRNHDAWDVVFAERVTRAWNDLRTSARRVAFDLARVAPDEAETDDWAGHPAPYRPAPVYSNPQPPAMIVAPPAPVRLPSIPAVPPRYLAAAVLAGLAGMVLFVAWPARDDGAGEVALAGLEAPVSTALSVPAGDPDAGASTGAFDVAPVDSPIVTAAPTAAGASPLVAAPAVPVPRFAPRASGATTASTLPSDASLAESRTAGTQSDPAPDAARTRAPAAGMSVATVGAGARASVASRDADARVAAVPEAAVGVTPHEQAVISQQPMVASSAAPVPESLPQPVPVAPDIDQASLLIGRFARAYQRGDIDAMSALFAQDAQSQGGGIAQIRAAYDRLFEQTSHRSISIRDIQWQVEDERARATGVFEISQARDREEKARISRGTIHFDIEQRDDRLLIARLEHTDRGH